MITQIYITNYALIKTLRLDLSQGFTTITGETGAGKSILLGALGLVLGKRAESSALANTEKKCVVEVTFSITNLDLEAFFEEHDLDFDPKTILRREILPSGKSRAFVNDTPVSLDVLKSLGSRLVDVHSQHDSALMRNQAFQLQMLDALVANPKPLLAYQEAFKTYKILLNEKDVLQNELTAQRDTDYLQFLVSELEQVQVQENELDALDEERARLQHAEDINQHLAQAHNLLAQEFGVLSALRDGYKNVQQVAAFMPELRDLAERLHSTEIEVDDIAETLHEIAENNVFDQSRLQTVTDRYNLLQHLLKKHNVQTDRALLEKYSELAEQLEMATHGAARLEKLEKALSNQLDILRKLSSELNALRKQRAAKLEAEMSGYLSELQLPHARLEVKISESDKPTLNGFSEVSFYFSANPGSAAQPLQKVASGGELSRVMLALKAILAQTNSLPAIIFDEIDTGISGETALRTAQILSQMGNQMQVIAITHLPQIAASGKHQLLVQKLVHQGDTETRISELSQKERVAAIAQMLSGAQTTEAAIRTAEELLAL